MKKKFYYAVASFMRLDMEKVWMNVSVTIRAPRWKKFPVTECIKKVEEKFEGIANPAAIQITNVIEISEEDYDAFNERAEKLNLF